LWRKLPGARSAGRVHSVALRLVCAREKEIEAFVPTHYWSVTAQLDFDDTRKIAAKVDHIDGKKLGQFDIDSAQKAKDIASDLQGQDIPIVSLEKKPARRAPASPFTTSTMQQEASRKLRFGAKRTMQAAQRLYEAGHITYMRTDGTNLSMDAVHEIRDLIGDKFSKAHLPDQPRLYKSKAANAQEAHEAIRPTTVGKQPGSFALDGDQAKLYDLIWKRTMACQMTDARFEDTKVVLESKDGRYGLSTTGRVTTFGGFMDLYREGLDDRDEAEDKKLPPLDEGEIGHAGDVVDEGHATKPPARFTEATLVKELERLGIGRPSTYASIISVLEDRGYVRIENRRFFAEDTGRVLSTFLEAFFEKYVAYSFTADLERKLDQITNGELDWLDVMREFWTGFEKAVEETAPLRVRDVIDVLDKELEHHLFPVTEENPTPRACPHCADGNLGLRLARNGAFIGCSNYPECSFTKSLTKGGGDSAASTDLPRELGFDEAGRAIWLKTGRYGPYVEQTALEEEKPKRAGLPKDISVDVVTLDLAIKLLAMPREVGVHEGEVVQAHLGRFGPYLTYGRKTAKLSSGLEALEIGMNLAMEKLAHAKERPPEKNLGQHPSGAEISQKAGRYGPYVQMGKIMATIPKAIDPETITLSQAIELIDKKAEKSGTKTKAAKPVRKRTTKAKASG